MLKLVVSVAICAAVGIAVYVTHNGDFLWGLTALMLIF